MILRAVVLAIGLIWLAFGAWLTVLDPAAWPTLVVPLILLAGIAFERFHYRGNAPDNSPGNWRKTNERFLDEETGRPVTVWFNATTGERKYVDE